MPPAGKFTFYLFEYEFFLRRSNFYILIRGIPSFYGIRINNKSNFISTRKEHLPLNSYNAPHQFYGNMPARYFDNHYFPL
ncbi:Uncharacterised protein [Pandoraea pulmonicola]|uniref:Uncharacterized protein n=1 Tax=Pandoraea pulmonicola TaxID=93221 RepID=A0AAJ5D016_PANPU|nr:Uncharacterised protein [Pandoraea pulmonicola]